MRIEIDVREKELIDILKVVNSMNGSHEIITKALPIGDIIIYDDEGNEQTRIVAQGIDQSKLVPLLVKTIQELEARITALEA